MTTFQYKSKSGKTIERTYRKGETIPTVIPEAIDFGSEEQEFFYIVAKD